MLKINKKFGKKKTHLKFKKRIKIKIIMAAAEDYWNKKIYKPIDYVFNDHY